jgi:hypothetical protein
MLPRPVHHQLLYDLVAMSTVPHECMSDTKSSIQGADAALVFYQRCRMGVSVSPAMSQAQ